jgi:ATP-dependent RNA helicase DHX57
MTGGQIWIGQKIQNLKEEGGGRREEGGGRREEGGGRREEGGGRREEGGGRGAWSVERGGRESEVRRTQEGEDLKKEADRQSKITNPKSCQGCKKLR